MAAPICPACGTAPRLTDGAEIYPHRRDLAGKPIWVCTICEDTDVGCHPGTEKPLGFPADAGLREARIMLHHSRIDPLWKKADRCGLYSPEDEHARYLLGVLDAPEPADRSDAFLRGKGLMPGHIVERNPRTNKVTSERWAVNIQYGGPAGPWAYIHGIEDGWLFRDRSEHLQASDEGLKRREKMRVVA